MNLSRKCCRWGCVVLIMLIGITTGSSVVQAGSEGTSSASRCPSGDAGAKKWSSPSSASGAKIKPEAKKPIIRIPPGETTLSPDFIERLIKVKGYLTQSWCRQKMQQS